LLEQAVDQVIPQTEVLYAKGRIHELRLVLARAGTRRPAEDVEPEQLVDRAAS
jgi:hypothetical protein